MAQEGEMLGSQFHHGGIRPVWGNGTSLPTPPPSSDIQLGTMVTGHAQESEDHGRENQGGRFERKWRRPQVTQYCITKTASSRAQCCCETGARGHDAGLQTCL